MSQNNDPDSLEKKILSNLQKGLLAIGEGKEAFDKAFDEMFPEEEPEENPPAPPSPKTPKT